MKHLKYFLQKNRLTVITIISFFCATLFFIHSSEIKEGTVKSIDVCLYIIVPSLFPMMFLSAFTSAIGLPDVLKKALNKPLNILFGIDGNCLEGLLSGLTGGYNIALKASVSLYKQGKITVEAARRIALFFTNPGIAFSISVTGSLLSGGINAGVRLYVYSIISCILTAFFYNIKNSNHIRYVSCKRDARISRVFIESVTTASSGIISVCFSIIIFSVFVSITKIIFSDGLIFKLISLIAEASSAIIYSAANMPTYVTAFCLTFGGFSIFIQSISDLDALNISPLRFLQIRLLQALICGAAEYIYCCLASETQAAYAAYSVRISHSPSAMGSVALLFLCLIFICETKRIKNQPRRQ